ncbi:putative B6 ABC transporter substrate-binding protein [Ruicaihuangia caeni]|uniref:BMP family ABC transporter substrate-binding protein n=1 Tax=Ruicaihuangia caeni TaxID=3042517 RepID=A0AAW6T586_9MICO|nr:BMP family ABC transporter substrate-binding protein [Klugiella sp. YN-L-19]MDI2098609.1 BMP family ABC transporter substrate-binding protein [Klugiella sp. YN-L-19]
MSRSTVLPRRLAKVGLAAVLGAALLATAGCTARGGDTGDTGDNGKAEGTKVEQFAIVTPEKESDHGWNQQGIWAAQQVADELGIKLDDNSNVGYDNTETILSQVAEKGNDFIIAHASGFNTAGARVGQSTGVPVLVVDYDQNVPGKVATVMTEAQEGAYLAGVAAAMSTTTKTVGVVVSAEDLNWFTMSGGFAQGVYSVDPSISVVLAYIGPAEYGDSAGGRNVAAQVIAAGADVIFGMGDGATVGYLQAIETANTGYPVRYIATIGDVTEAVTDPSIVLTSVLWNFADAYKQAIADIEAGTFGEKSYSLTVENGGLTLQESDQLTDEILAAVEEAKKGIIDGSVKVEKTTTKDAVQAVIDAH